MNLIETLIGFLVFFVLWIGGAFFGSGVLGFLLGIAALFAIASGKAGEWIRTYRSGFEDRDNPGTF